MLILVCCGEGIVGGDCEGSKAAVVSYDSTQPWQVNIEV